MSWGALELAVDLLGDAVRDGPVPTVEIERSRIPRYINGYRIPHKTGDFLPYIANDVGVFESD